MGTSTHAGESREIATQVEACELCWDPMAIQ
jgi:hypothetical protein